MNMPGGRDVEMDLYNDTAVNVVALLREAVGATREYRLSLAELPLGDDLTARGISGTVRLTRLTDDILATIRASGEVELECQRCLEPYLQPFETAFSEQFRSTIDVQTGRDLSIADDERFKINENHELDFREPLRQEILVSLPMRPVCGDDCPGPPVVSIDDEETDDERFAALRQLLDNEP